MKRKIMIINGPNLNMLGFREPHIYQTMTYNDLCNYLSNRASDEWDIIIHQTNHEGHIIDLLQQAFFEQYTAVILNAGAYTHYSYAIHDAVKAINLPVIEVHLTNIYNREEFRQTSLLASVCQASFYGKHFESYLDALEYIMKGF